MVKPFQQQNQQIHRQYNQNQLSSKDNNAQSLNISPQNGPLTSNNNQTKNQTTLHNNSASTGSNINQQNVFNQLQQLNNQQNSSSSTTSINNGSNPQGQGNLNQMQQMNQANVAAIAAAMAAKQNTIPPPPGVNMVNPNNQYLIGFPFVSVFKI